MKTLVKCLVVLLAPVLLGACAGKNTAYLPKYAITDPGEAISVPHPTEMQNKGVKFVTTWTGVMHPDLLVEVIKGNGVFPVIGYNGQKEFYGWAYVVDLNHWGDWIVRYEFPNSLEELNNASFIIVNRDVGFIYSMMGQRIAVDDTIAMLQKNNKTFSVEKFDTDDDFRMKFVSKHGMTINDLNKSWRRYYANKIFKGRLVNTAVTESFATEYVVGSKKWVAMVETVNREIDSGKQSYGKIDGAYRVSRMNSEEFTDKASDVHDFTTGNRILKRTTGAALSLAAVAISPVALAGVGFAGTVYSANVDNNWHGHTLRSQFLGHELAPTFVWVCERYKKLLVDRDEEIRKLTQPTTQLSRK